MDLHQRLQQKVPDVEKNWAIVKELLQHHEFNLDDLAAMTGEDSKFYYTGEDPKLYYFNKDKADADFDAFKDDLYNSEISDQVIPGSDLTEDDIRRIFRTLFLGFFKDDLWATFVIYDRFQPLSDYFFDFNAAVRNSGNIQDLAHLANVNFDMAAVVYDRVYTYPDMKAQVFSLLQPEAKSVFLNHEGLKPWDLQRGQKREDMTRLYLKK